MRTFLIYLAYLVAVAVVVTLSIAWPVTLSVTFGILILLSAALIFVEPLRPAWLDDFVSSSFDFLNIVIVLSVFACLTVLGIISLLVSLIVMLFG